MPELEETAPLDVADGDSLPRETGPVESEGEDLAVEDASSGPPEEETIDHWKHRHQETRRWGEEQAQKARELEIRYQEAINNRQAQQWSFPQAQPVQPQPAQPQFDNDGYTAEERQQLEDASDKLDLRTVTKLQNQAAKRLQQQALVGGLLLSTQLSSSQQQQQQVEQALEARIRNLGEEAWPAVIQEARQIQADPSQVMFLRDNSQQSYRQVDTGTPVNLWALEKAADRLAARATRQKKITRSDIEAPQIPRNEPGKPVSSKTFNPKTHLTELERRDVAMIQNRDPKWTHERYFKSLPEGMQKLRKEGKMITLREYRQRYAE